jgi:hypothetical protein
MKATGLLSTWSLLGLLTAASLPRPVLAWPATGVPDTQLWSELNVTGPLMDKFTITGVAQWRGSDSLPNPTYTAGGVDLNYEGETWEFSLGYRHQVTGHETYDPTVTQIARLTAAHRWKIDRSTIIVRFRVENTITASDNPWRIRLRAEYRWATQGLRDISYLRAISYLYTNDEVFYRFDKDQWFRNRFQAGFNLNLSKLWALKVYYQRQDDLLSHPGAINALGLTAELTFE